jgi:predicted DNA-binding transcriptional regulator AlpA
MSTYHSSKEVAERYKISKRTLGRWREEGGGPEYIRVGPRLIGYADAALAAWDAAHTHPDRTAEKAKEAAAA